MIVYEQGRIILSFKNLINSRDLSIAGIFIFYLNRGSESHFVDNEIPKRNFFGVVLSATFVEVDYVEEKTVSFS